MEDGGNDAYVAKVVFRNLFLFTIQDRFAKPLRRTRYACSKTFYLVSAAAGFTTFSYGCNTDKSWVILEMSTLSITLCVCLTDLTFRIDQKTSVYEREALK